MNNTEKKNKNKKWIIIALAVLLVGVVIATVVVIANKEEAPVVESSVDAVESSEADFSSEADASTSESVYTSDEDNTSETADISDVSDESSEDDNSNNESANAGGVVDTSEDVNTSSIDNHEHTYKTSVVEATCDKDGYTLHTCEVCGDSYKTDTVKATGHTYGEWVTTVAATTTSEGKQERTCEVCGKKETKKISKLTVGEYRDGDYTVVIGGSGSPLYSIGQYWCVGSDSDTHYHVTDWKVIHATATEKVNKVRERYCEDCGIIEREIYDYYGNKVGFESNRGYYVYETGENNMYFCIYDNRSEYAKLDFNVTWMKDGSVLLHYENPDGSYSEFSYPDTIDGRKVHQIIISVGDANDVRVRYSG